MLEALWLTWTFLPGNIRGVLISLLVIYAVVFAFKVIALVLDAIPFL